MAITAQQSEQQRIDEYKNSWDAFLDAYSSLQTDKNNIEGLCSDVLSAVSKRSAKYAALAARYKELTGKEHTWPESQPQQVLASKKA